MTNDSTDSTPANSSGDSEVPAYIANRPRLDEEWGAGIMSPYGEDEPQGPTEEERKKKREGLRAVIDEFEAECGPISEEAKEWARAALSFDSD